MKRTILFLFILISTSIFAQKNLHKINDLKAKLDRTINWPHKGIADSLSTIRDKKLLETLIVIEKNYKTNSVSPVEPFVELWQKGASNASNEKDRYKLITSIINSNDSVLIKNFEAINLFEEVPPKQTECCAILGYTSYKSEIVADVHPYIFAALATSPMLKNNGSSNGPSKAMQQMIEDGLTRNELKSGSATYFKLLDSLIKKNKKMEPESSNNKSDKKQPIWLWMLGGFVIAGIITYLLTREKKQEISS